jgi:hypothetical protein
MRTAALSGAVIGADGRMAWERSGIPTLSGPDHKYSGLFGAVRDRIAGACEYCPKADGVPEGVESAGIELLGEYEQHPSLHRYAIDGYQVITF